MDCRSPTTKRPNVKHPCDGVTRLKHSTTLLGKPRVPAPCHRLSISEICTYPRLPSSSISKRVRKLCKNAFGNLSVQNSPSFCCIFVEYAFCVEEHSFLTRFANPLALQLRSFETKAILRVVSICRRSNFRVFVMWFCDLTFRFAFLPPTDLDSVYLRVAG